jgi:hypothetical protein
MRNTLQRRLAQLERRAGITGLPRITLIVHRVVKPNGKFGGDDEPARAEANGRVWHREAGETRKHFESRVKAEALNHNRDNPLPTQIIFFPAEEGDADFNPGTSSSGSDA